MSTEGISIFLTQTAPFTLFVSMAKHLKKNVEYHSTLIQNGKLSTSRHSSRMCGGTRPPVPLPLQKDQQNNPMWSNNQS
ncbi:hypothetical protein Ocin01_18979 [Orchesella cincta]|uniref:Uncharacterized protein n=1 Tax=Orchesella cincta TaxID=48709 RepID=A0A1D2M440_ORCCI|nr:hypothetical protein Ocin01_18979 [Orchesella cincta]